MKAESMSVQSPSSRPILAFDIGGTRIKAGVVHGTTVSSLTTIPTTSGMGADDTLEAIVRLGRDLMAELDVAAVGLCVKGIVDPTKGILLDVNEVLSGWIGRPLAALIADELNCPTYMENDARMYALGELKHGAGHGYDNVVCLTLGTGIGSSASVGGRLLRGPRGTAGILGGHITIQVNGPPCTCGNIGCLEALIGTAGLTRSARSLLTNGQPSVLRCTDLTPRHIFAAAAEGDAIACEVVRCFTKSLGAGVVTLIHTYDPDLIVIGGGMAQAAEQYLPAIQSYADQHGWTIPRGRVRVARAALGDGAALIGAAELTRNEDVFL
jgi:glucokinase